MTKDQRTVEYPLRGHEYPQLCWTRPPAADVLDSAATTRRLVKVEPLD